MSEHRVSKIKVAAFRKEALRRLSKACDRPDQVLDYLYQVHALVFGNSFANRELRDASFEAVINRLGRPHDKRRTPAEPFKTTKWKNSNAHDYRSAAPNPYYRKPSVSLDEWLRAPLRSVAHVERWLQGYHVDDSYGYPPVAPRPTKLQLERRKQRELADAAKVARKAQRAADRQRAAERKAARKLAAAPATTRPATPAQAGQTAPPAAPAELLGTPYSGTSAPAEGSVLGQAGNRPG